MILATENIFPIVYAAGLYNLRSVRTQLSFFSWFSIVRIGNARTLGNKFKNEFKTLTSKCAAWDSWQNNAMEKSWLIGCPLVFNERTEEEQLNSLEQVVNKLFLKFCQTKKQSKWYWNSEKKYFKSLQIIIFEFKFSLSVIRQNTGVSVSELVWIKFVRLVSH